MWPAVFLALAQPPAAPEKKPPPDETRAIVREIEEAYKAPREADKDIRDELRKLYRTPTPDRESKLLYEVRRLYQTTPEQEAAIRREAWEAARVQTPEQEERVFAEVRRGGRLPPGTVHPTTQAEQAGKLFRKFDQNGDGKLGPDEQPADLRGQLARWDRDGDGVIDADEYTLYFQSRHLAVFQAVISGEITLKLPKDVPGPAAAKPPADDARPVVVRAGKMPAGLPGWFTKFDEDGDGMVGLYEWRRRGRRIADFLPIDRNGDGYLTPKEVLDYLAGQPANPAERPQRAAGTPDGQ